MGTGRERKGKFPSGGWCTGLFPTSKEEGSRRKSFCWFTGRYLIGFQKLLILQLVNSLNSVVLSNHLKLILWLF